MKRIATMTSSDLGFHDQRKIPAIKALRKVTGWDLKESKDFIDALAQGSNSFPVNDNVSENKLSETMQSINNDTGYSIKVASKDNPVRRELNKQINSTLAYASLAGEFDVVRALTTVLESHLTFDLTNDNNDDDDDRT